MNSSKIPDSTAPDRLGDDFAQRLKAFTESEKAEKSKARKVIVFFAGEGLGDFVRQNMAAAALTRPLSAYVAAIFKNHPPYREFITQCNPYINLEMKADPGADVTIPIDWFDIGVFAPVKCSEPQWEEIRLDQPDVILLPGMLRCDLARLSGLAETPPLLRLPPERAEHLSKSLAERGLAPNHWFACLHVSGNPESHLPLISHIIDNQGGRVVLIGAPEAAKTLEMKGVVHLSQSLDFLPDHVTAISQARYFMGDVYDSTVLASAFRTPCAATNALQYAGRIWNKGDVVLAKRIAEPGGKPLTTRAAFEKGYLDEAPPKGAKCLENTTKELIAVSDHMRDLTSGRQGWRAKPDEINVEAADGVAFPFPMRDKPLLTFWE